MAGDWIKMRTDLHTHPKVVRMASALKADRLRVVGGLHAAWSVFDAHSTDGILRGYSFEAMDSVLGWDGFSNAMQSVGWLETDGDDGLKMPEFQSHNGKSAKRRAQESERKRSDREAAQIIRDASASDADKKRTREEKRREDKNNTAASLPSWVPVSAWDGYVEMRAKIRKPLTERGKSLALRKLDDLRARGFDPEAVLNEAVEHSWQGIYEPKAGAARSDKFAGAML